jgi:non-ribosomal peptide synthetase component E (peptide arylation enzyme)
MSVVAYEYMKLLACVNAWWNVMAGQYRLKSSASSPLRLICKLQQLFGTEKGILCYRNA